VTARPRAGWHAYRPGGEVALPGWAVEVALTVERPSEPATTPQRWPPEPATGPRRWPPEPAPGWDGWPLLLLRSAGRLAPVAPSLGQAVREVEEAAGLRRRATLRLPVPAALAGAEPVVPGDVLGHLEVAAARGLPRPTRRRAPAVAGAAGSVWRAGPGAVVACAGRYGVSAQAAIALCGSGDPAVITPRPGGALQLRAWRVGRRWGLAAALVLSASESAGLGREAKRCVAELRAGGWLAGLATGAAALALVRSGDPRCHVQPAGARPADSGEVAALLGAFLTAARLPTPSPPG